MAMVWGSERRTLHFRRFQTPRQTSSHHLLVIRQPQKHRCRTCASLFLPPRRGFFSCTWGAKKWHPALRCHVAKQIQNQADKSRPSIRPVPAPLNIEAPHLHQSFSRFKQFRMKPQKAQRNCHGLQFASNRARTNKRNLVAKVNEWNWKLRLTENFVPGSYSRYTMFLSTST